LNHHPFFALSIISVKKPPQVLWTQNFAKKKTRRTEKVVNKIKVATKQNKTFPTFQTPMIIWWSLSSIHKCVCVCVCIDCRSCWSMHRLLIHVGLAERSVRT
jgi:hypothetical protein